MEESEAKICENCKREIPAVNFTIHSVHCARNLRVCPVCKEPVPHQELQEHHDRYHKLLPCKQCGESVCGTDLEDHIRDSCGHTIKSCRFCELELPRHELPAHENYCGVRTEQCPDCKEWVMIKYRQLHLDSNHGFLRLDDDPVVQPKKESPKPTNVPTPSRQSLPRKSNVTKDNSSKNKPKITYPNRPRTEIRCLNDASPLEAPGSSRDGAVAGASGAREVQKAPPKRTNDQPQINTTVANLDKVHKDLFKHLHLGRESDDETRWVMGSARSGAGAAGNSAEATSSAWTAGNGARSQGSDMRTTRGGATTAGSSARAADNSAGAAGSNAGAASSSAEAAESNAGPADSRVEVMSSNAGAGDSSAGASGSIARSPGSDARSPRSDARSPGSDARSPGSDARSPGSSIWAPGSDARSPGSGARSLGSDARSPGNSIWAWDGPGAAGTGAGATEARAGGSDRFSEIKSSLQELRRGLNEVTAPYNSNISPSDNNINVRPSPRRVNRDPRGSQGFQGHQGPQGHQGTRAPWGSQASDAPQAATQVPLTAQAIAAHDGCEVNAQLPCEFCNVLVPANHLVLHQTGCRPDLTQLRPDLMQLQPRGRGFRRAAPSFYDTLHEEPVIPCEFCTESLPLYLIIEHQERCRRESDQQFPD